MGPAKFKTGFTLFYLKLHYYFIEVGPTKGQKEESQCHTLRTLGTESEWRWIKQKCKVIRGGTYITWIYTMHENLWDGNGRQEISLLWLISNSTMCPHDKAKSSLKEIWNIFGKCFGNIFHYFYLRYFQFFLLNTPPQFWSLLFKTNHSLSGASRQGSNQYDWKIGQPVLRERLNNAWLPESLRRKAERRYVCSI